MPSSSSPVDSAASAFAGAVAAAPPPAEEVAPGILVGVRPKADQSDEKESLDPLAMKGEQTECSSPANAKASLPSLVPTLGSVLFSATPPLPPPPRRYKVVICGDSGVGKTTFVKRHMTETFEEEYAPTVKVEVNVLRFRTSGGLVTVDLYDVSGEDEKAGQHHLRTVHYARADAAIIMFDVKNRSSYLNVPIWWQELNWLMKGTIVLVGNKMETAGRAVEMHQVKFHRKKLIQYYEISVKAGYNFEKPFQWILRRLANDPELQILDSVSDCQERYDKVFTTLACLLRRREVLYANERAEKVKSDTPDTLKEGGVELEPRAGGGKTKTKKDKRMLEGELAFTIITSADVWRHILGFV